LIDAATCGGDNNGVANNGVANNDGESERPIPKREPRILIVLVHLPNLRRRIVDRMPWSQGVCGPGDELNAI
jgi:hypothetical protein